MRFGSAIWPRTGDACKVRERVIRGLCRGRGRETSQQCESEEMRGDTLKSSTFPLGLSAISGILGVGGQRRMRSGC